ncbi:MAG: NMD3-related protein [Candidatus Woesearchaeota archaeon]|nr:NMD3-related protein [Candidatus Woesearchaeota archaeon]
MKLEFNMEQMMCSSCKKTSTEYYELKLQLRFMYFQDIDEVKEEALVLLNKTFDSINKVEELDGGYDIFFRSHSLINKVSSTFNNKYFIEEKRSKKIVGHNFLESKSVWRHTLLINIINLKTKDRIKIRGEIYWIKAFNKKELVLRNESDGSKYVVSYNMISDYFELLGDKE